MEADYSLLELDERELDIAIGSAISEGEFGAKDLTDAEKRRRGNNWFNAQIPDLRTALCAQPFVDAYLETSTAERELFDAIIAVLSSVLGVPVPVGVLAAKTIRYGVGRLCIGDVQPSAATA